MKNFKITRIIIAILLLNTFQFAQVDNSIYTMMGIGSINDNGYGINKMLGGTGIAFSTNKNVSYLNPASYMGLQQSSHIVEAGVYGMQTYSETKYENQTTSKVNFDFLAMNFYLTNWWASNIGLSPYSYVNYSVTSEDQIEGELTTLEKEYSGSGGLNRIYWGNAFNIVDRLNLGFNLSYITGPITQTEIVNSTDNLVGYELEHQIKAHSVYLDYGLQYAYEYENLDFTIGAVYGPKTKINTSETLKIIYSSSEVSLETEDEAKIKIPEKFGFGIGLTDNKNFRIGLDYELSKWSSIKFNNEHLEAVDANRFALGLEFTPTYGIRSAWYEKLTYRLGGNFKNTYMKIDGENINSFSVNLGFGIPYDQLTSLNLGFEYGQEGTLNNGLIKSNFFKFYLNISLHEFWKSTFSY